MFSLSTPSESSSIQSSNMTSIYGLLSMTVEAVSYWLGGTNPRVSAQIENIIEKPDPEEAEWKSYSEQLRRLTGAEGNEFQVNTYVTSSQENPAVASLTDGGFVIAWESDGQDGSGYGVYGQRYTSSAIQYGSEFLVNTYTNADQSYPAVAALSDGGFVITWHSDGQDGSGYGIYAKRYTSSSSVYGSEFRVNTYTTNHQWFSDVTALSDGGFLIAWGSAQDGSTYGVYAQRYTSSGALYGSEFLVNTYTYSSQWYPAIAGLSGGGFVIAWHSYTQDGSGYGVYAQRYTSSSSAYGSEFLVNTYTDYPIFPSF